MVKRFSEKYSFQLPAIRKLCLDAYQLLMLHPYILPQEQTAKTNMASMVRIQVYLVLCTVEDGEANTSI